MQIQGRKRRNVLRRRRMMSERTARRRSAGTSEMRPRPRRVCRRDASSTGQMAAEYVDAVVLPLPQRVARAVGESPVSERVTDAQEFVYGPVLDWARRSPLHTDALGHSVHPLLTDLTLGCGISASILDLAGGLRHVAPRRSWSEPGWRRLYRPQSRAPATGQRCRVPSVGSVRCTRWAPTSPRSSSWARLSRGCVAGTPPAPSSASRGTWSQQVRDSSVDIWRSTVEQRAGPGKWAEPLLQAERLTARVMLDDHVRVDDAPSPQADRLAEQS